MKLGTHNSMSYLPPKKWYLYPFRFMARCLKCSIKEQYELGARMFDLRIKFDKHNVPEFRHGPISYKGNVEDVLKYLNSTEEKVHVRLILEVNNNSYKQEILFSFYCDKWENDYKNITFFCGRRKYDWRQLYKFLVNDIELIQKVASMVSPTIDDLCPWLYARFNNKKNFNNWDTKDWLLLDFIEYALE